MHGRNIYGPSHTTKKGQNKKKKKEKCQAKKDKLQPNEPKIKIVRRNSINSGIPNCEYL